MQPNTSLGERHHHTTLKVENNQGRRRTTFWSLSKLPVSDLYWKLFAWGNTFFLDPLGIADPITPPPPPPPPFFFSLLSFFPLPTVLLGLKSSLEGTLWPHVNTPLTPWITLITLSIYLRFLSNHVLPQVSYGSLLGYLFDLPCT